MDQPKRPSGKTYSDVMNEWAAQKHFVQGTRSRLLHPPYDAHPVAKALGYLWRLTVVLAVPLVIYLVLLQQYGKSKEFNTLLSDGIATALKGETATAKGAAWKFDGMLVLKSLEVSGRPEAFFEKVEARNIGTKLPFSKIFRREWILPRVSIEDLSIALRSGGLGTVPLYDLTTDPDEEVPLPPLPPADEPVKKTSLLRSPAPGVMRAGYGIAPDFAALRINAVQTARLHVSWGSSPAAAGAVSGMQTDMSRSAAGWVITGNGGEWRQGWIDSMQLQKLAVTLGPGKAVLDEVVFTRPGGGKARLTGSMTLGELPTVDAELKLEAIRLQDLVADSAGSLFSAEASGAVKMTGSVNRSSGIRMEGKLELGAGWLTGLPILKALHQLTGEDPFRQLPLRSGSIVFNTSGSEEHGGLIVEIKKFEADCGPLAKLKGTYRQEQIIQTGDIDGSKPVDRMKASGHFQLGVPVTVTAKLKPAVAARFFKPGSDGWAWMDLHFEGQPNSNLSRELAAEIIKADAQAP